jgi:hypothetical protein
MSALRIIGPYVYCPRALLMPTQRLARRSTSNTLCATTTISWRIDRTARLRRLSQPTNACHSEAIMSDIDLSVADSAYATLLDARHTPRNTAADLARLLMNETENPRCSI